LIHTAYEPLSLYGGDIIRVTPCKSLRSWFNRRYLVKMTRVQTILVKVVSAHL
jgi:hypothetical protein